MPEARTKPGSRAHLLVQITEELNECRGRGVEVSEIRAAFTELTGETAPKSLTAEISSLKRRGILHVVGGRAGRTLYAAVRLKFVGKQNPDDDAFIVLGALQMAYRRLRRPLSTREVAAEVRRRGYDDLGHVNAVRKRLETLSLERKRGPKSFKKPRAIRIQAVTDFGAPSAHWIPASAAREGVRVPAPRSMAEAVRQAVRLVEDELGLSPSRSELRWWLQSQEADPRIRELIPPNQLGRVLADAVKSDRRWSGYAGRVHALRTRYTCHGGAAERYSWGPPIFSAAASLEDTLYTLLPADEMESIKLLRRRAESIRSRALEELADLRTQLLRHLVHHAGGEEGAAIDWIPSLERIGVVHRRWLANTPELSRDQIDSRERVFSEREHQLGSLKQLLRQPCPLGPAPALSVGEALLSTLGDLEEFSRAAAKMEGTDPEDSKALITAARRFPVRDRPGAERFGAAAELPLSLVDRVDALHLLFEIMPTPRAAMLLSQAELLIGRVFRDPAVLNEMYRTIPEGDSITRRTFAVALGLLGEHLPFEEVVPDQADYDDATAWVLSIVLAEGSGAWSTINQADRRAKGSARKVTDAALARIEVGYLFSVVG